MFHQLLIAMPSLCSSNSCFSIISHHFEQHRRFLTSPGTVWSAKTAIDPFGLGNILSSPIHPAGSSGCPTGKGTTTRGSATTAAYLSRIFGRRFTVRALDTVSVKYRIGIAARCIDANLHLALVALSPTSIAWLPIRQWQLQGRRQCCFWLEFHDELQVVEAEQDADSTEMCCLPGCFADFSSVLCLNPAAS